MPKPPLERSHAQSGAMTLTLPQAMRRALAAYERGALAEAESLCRLIIRAKSDCSDALSLLGFVTAQTQRTQESVEYLGRAVATDPTNAMAHHNYGQVLQQLGRSEAALASYDRALEIKPDFSQAHLSRGNTLQELRRLEEALDSYDRALNIRPNVADAHYRRGNVLQKLGRLDAAVESYDRALRINPDFVEAHDNRGLALERLGQLDAALESHNSALRINPDFPGAYVNRGNVLKELKRLDEALDSYDCALKIKPAYAEAYYNRGVALQDLRRLGAALDSFDRALGTKPHFAEAHDNRGNVLQELGRYDEALDSYDRALKAKPDDAEIYANRGNALQRLGRLDEALDSYDRALRIKPNLKFLYGAWLHTRMKLCDWRDLGRLITELFSRIERAEAAIHSFPLVALTTSPALQRKATQIWVDDQNLPSLALPPIMKREMREKIRIGYYSADYHNHATAYLMAELFEQHDRSRFELFAFSFGPGVDDDMRRRISAAFDQFIDVRETSDKAVALKSRNMEIDIAVDLKGLTQDSRPGIFAMRAAPIQVNYIGYPGTMGAEYIDYLIADRTVIPEVNQEHYTEKIAYLPNAYQANDRRRAIADKVFTREELALPETGFVFCSFNSTYKITPDTFDGWMRILKQVDGSVLWLLDENPKAARNLRMEANARGVSEERLIFAKKMPLSEHLARCRTADLFIDTLPCNAHTTASDVLWAGVPVLTCIGHTFPGRVAASLLKAIDLPELITTAQEQYEALAVELATNRQQLRHIREKLKRNRLTTPLFDTQLFARQIEQVYKQMYERYQADLAPDHIYASG